MSSLRVFSVALFVITLHGCVIYADPNMGRVSRSPGGTAARTGYTPSLSPTKALTCIGTETGSPVRFRFRWGENSPWSEVVTANPGKWRSIWHTYDYAGENRSPQLQINFDDNLTSKFRPVIVNLRSMAAAGENCERDGMTYNFYQRGAELIVKQER